MRNERNKNNKNDNNEGDDRNKNTIYSKNNYFY